MNIHLLILSIALMVISIWNFYYFVKKYIVQKEQIQLYMLILFFVYILLGLDRLISCFTESLILTDILGFSILLTALVLSTGFSMAQWEKASKIFSISFLAISIFYIIGVYSGLFVIWNLDNFFNTLIISLSGILSITGVIFLGIYWGRTKLSPLLGLFIGILIPVIFRILVVVNLIDSTIISTTYIDFLMNLAMYLGFNNFLKFKKKEKITESKGE